MEAIGEQVSTGDFRDLEFLVSSTAHWLDVVGWDEIETQDVHTIIIMVLLP